MNLDITAYVDWIRVERRLSSSLMALARWGLVHHNINFDTISRLKVYLVIQNLCYGALAAIENFALPFTSVASIIKCRKA